MGARWCGGGAAWGRYVGHVLIRAIDAAGPRRRCGSIAATGAAAVEAGANTSPTNRATGWFLPARAGTVRPCAATRSGWPAVPRALGALTRAIGIAGLLERILNQTVQYANERTQFGRPIRQVPGGAAATGDPRQRDRGRAHGRGVRLLRRSMPRTDPGGDGRQGDLRAVRRPRGRHRASGARRDRLHARAFRCTNPRGACGLGVPSAAPRRTGRRRSADVRLRGGDALWADLTAAAA